MSEIEYRSALIGDVNWPKRMIELIVMPYESPTVINDRGRTFEEIVSRTAFQGVEERTSQIKLNLDHRRETASTVGRAVALHPSRHEGLVAEVKIFKSHPMGDATLELASEESLGASAGFTLLMDKQTGKAKQDAEVWETTTRRRLNHLFLDHIAMTPDPAYTDAKVLAVRTAPVTPQEPQGGVSTPNLDRLRLAALLEREAALNSRWLSGKF
jgi:phage head maturation protease